MTDHTKETRLFSKCLKRYHRRWRVLQEVDIILKDFEDGEDASAEYPAGARTDSNPEYDNAAVVLFTEALKGKSPQEIERIARHELVHVILSPQHRVVEHLLGHLPAGKKEVFTEWYRTSHEQVTSRLEETLSHA